MMTPIIFTLNTDDVKDIANSYIELPENKEVADKIQELLVDEMVEIAKGNTTTEKVMQDILNIEKMDFVKTIIEQSAITLDLGSFESLVQYYSEQGVTYMTGASVEDLNVEDVYERITPEYTDVAYGGLVNLEKTLNLKDKENLNHSIFIYKNEYNGDLMLAILI